ncbi:BfmA/BtgA family mobilization protein [uncultured Croceitalea sp.]|uniref:BfmA/BtgA family mobilization protein n=1 Tax=uncultured Croceitalea sp. TaxID=1798908 RepID=UPI00374E39CD
MVVKGKYEYKYLALNLKASVVKRFRSFAKKIAGSQSEALEKMINFFEWHGFKPNDRFADSILEEIRKNRKRTEANIAILRDIEVTQTKPSNTMLLSLFGENLRQQEPVRREKKFVEKPKRPQKEIDTTVPKIRYERLQEEMKRLSQDFDYVLGKARLVKSSFGKPYLKLEISSSELARYRRKASKIISGE